MIKLVKQILKINHVDFRQIEFLSLEKSMITQFGSPLYLTPRYQKFSYSQDFLKYVRYLQRSDYVPYSKMREFVQNILVEHQRIMSVERPEIQLRLSKNVKIPKSKIYRYFGEVDWMYSIGKFNMTPVMFSQQYLNPTAGIALAQINMFMRKILKQQLQKQHKASQKKYDHVNAYAGNNLFGYSLITTGHEWQIIRVDANYQLQKSVVIEGRNKYRSMIHDQQMISVVFGMIDYCLDLPETNVKVLQKSYQYLQERKWMLQGADDSQAKNASWLSKILTNYYRKKL